MGWRNRPFAPTTGTKLCSLRDIPDGGVREIIFGDGKREEGKPFRMLVLRRGSEVRGYLNICPHMRLPLNIRRGPFQMPEPAVLECANHFARFRFEDGVCTDGVCEPLQSPCF